MRRPDSPSLRSWSSCGLTAVISCMMIEAEMYGMMPSAKIVKRRKAPPENMLNMPRMPPCWSLNRSASTCSVSGARSRASATSPRVRELKPRLGKRRCSGIWPPSKPSLWKPPERAFCPLCPRPAVLPQPEPPPRPTRCRSFFEPGAGFREFSRMGSVVDTHEVIDAVDHAAHRRGIGELDRLVDLLQPEPAHRVAVALLG